MHFLYSTFILSLLFLFAYPAHSKTGITKSEIKKMAKIAEAIAKVEPKLDTEKYMEYAYGIHLAAEKYKVDPNVLVAITHNESNFNSSIKEGAAGELGICQIKKSWVKNDKFKKEFGKIKEADLKKPVKAFTYAAWILHEIRDRLDRRALPYWSYYNAKNLEPRKQYFKKVDRTLASVTGKKLNHKADTQPDENRQNRTLELETATSKVEKAVVLPSFEMDAMATASSEKDILGIGPTP